MKNNKKLLTLMFVILGIAVILFLIYATKGQTSNKTVEDVDKNKISGNNEQMNNQTERKKYTGAPKMIIDKSKDYSAKINTNMGVIVVDLFEKDSPKTVNNFVVLAKDGFYDGIIFHRIIKDFMIQGGDPTGTGRGGPGYAFEDEFNDMPLVQGSLAMANAGPNTNGSQFFIVTAEKTPWLDGKHTNFGVVTEGLDTVMDIQDVETGAMDKPMEDVVIESIEIVEK